MFLDGTRQVDTTPTTSPPRQKSPARGAEHFSVINTDLRSPEVVIVSKKEIDFRKDRRERHKLRRVAADLTKGIPSLKKKQTRLFKCGWVPVGDGVEVKKTDDNKRASYGAGLCYCGLGWLCPDCARIISEYNRKEIRLGLETWFLKGGSAFMATFTIQHKLKDENGEYVRLADTLAALQETIRWFKSGKGWQLLKAEFGILGDIKSLEITVSLENGWHPHPHILFISNLPVITKEIADRIKEKFYKRYFDLLKIKGKYADFEHGLDIVAGNLGVGDYLTKMGLEGADFEMAKGNVKSGRKNGHYSPFEVLKLAEAGDGLAVKWFQEFAEASNGLTAVKWSKHLRKKIGLSAEEKTDEEKLEQEIAQEKHIYFVIDNWIYTRVRRLHGKCQTAQHLEAAEERENPDDFEEYLHQRFGEPIEERSETLQT